MTDWDAVNKEKQRNIAIGRAMYLAQNDMFKSDKAVIGNEMDYKLLCANYYRLRNELGEMLK